MVLSIQAHDRDVAGLTYVYPVLSRRAGGVSIGINLNINNACNWACVYCQVPALIRGGPAPIALDLLERELRSFLNVLLAGDYLAKAVEDPAARRVVDLAFSGNGEPTAAVEFPQAVDLAIRVLLDAGLLGQIPLRVITNGSQLGKAAVRTALRRLADVGGEIWFKIDRIDPLDVRAINGVTDSPRRRLRLLEAACACASTWIQTCWFAVDGAPPSAAAVAAYVDWVGAVAGRIAGVHLYGLARPSRQPAASRLSRLDRDVLDDLAVRLRSRGVHVQVSP